MSLLQSPAPTVTSPTSSPPPAPPPSAPPPATSPPPQPSPATGSATLTWSPNSETDLAGYKVYVGTQSGLYTFPGSPFTIGSITSYMMTNLPSGQTYFFALSAYDNGGNESPLSAEVSKSIY
jgi:fibronectin type III domain protein